MQQHPAEQYKKTSNSNAQQGPLKAILLFIALACFDQSYAQEAGTPTGNQDLSAVRPTPSVTSTSGPNVAVLAYCTDLAGIFGAQNTVNTLVADGRFGNVTLVDGDVVQPTAQDLLNSFDVVIAMTDNRCGVPIPHPIADSAANAITGFAQGGGGLVVSTFGFSHVPSGGLGFGTSIFGSGLSPLQQAIPFSNAPAGAINIAGASTLPPCDQLLAGITSPLSSVWANNVSLSSGATLCASYTNGRPLLAINTDGNVVGLNTFTADQSDNTQASYRRLISNAVFAVVRKKTLAEKAAALAKTLKGAPYGYGGKGYDFKVVPNSYVDANAIFGGYNYKLYDCNTEAFIGLVRAKGVDCSGLVMWSYNTAFGATTKFDKGNPIQYPTANGQYLHDATIPVTNVDDLKPGDLLFFNYGHGIDPDTKLPKEADHVAMYVGGDDVLEAYTCLAQFPSGNFVIPSSKRTRYTTDLFGLSLPQCKPGMTKACFVGFRRVPIPGTTSSVNLRVATQSPVTLAVTDPDGFSITADTLSFTDREVLREVADVLYYIEDTNSDDTVISPVLKTGAYLIKVFPKPGTTSTDTYSIVVDAAGSTLTLADKVPIRNIPSQGYGVRSTGAAISQFIPVVIDIKPDSSDNPINPKSNGQIPVAILSSTTFNAPREVDVTSLSFGRTGNKKSLAFCNTGGEDVNGDGLPDLVCHFDTQTAAFRSGDTQGILNGKTIAGVPITGKDAVRIVP